MQIPSLASAGVTYTMPLLGNHPLPAGAPPVPLVVSAIDANGSPSYVYPISNGSGSGVTASDPVLLIENSGSVAVPPPSNIDSRLKAAFVEFLWLRHGGSGYIFGNGNAWRSVRTSTMPTIPNPLPITIPNGSTLGIGIPADRPFHSLSYPDIDFTVMRPSTLPPSVFTNPQPNATPALTSTPPVFYSGDAGVRNINLYPGYATATVPMGNPLAPIYPSAIPARRLFQVPDFTFAASAAAPFSAFASNAGDSGDPIINNQVPGNSGAYTGSIPAAGALPPYSITAGGTTYAFTFNNQVTTDSPGATFSLYPGLTQGGTFTITPAPGTPPTGFPTVLELGTGATFTAGTPPTIQTDNREHPYFRMEMLQRIMNLTTPRTHQYAVWITIGFFEVIRPGDLGMLNSANPALAFDVLGPEVGAVTGQKTRYRGFYLIDRLQLTSFSSNTPGSYAPAVVYRNRIQ